MGRSEKLVLIVAALGLATGAAAWIADLDQATALATALPSPSERLSFEDRFHPVSLPQTSRLQPLDTAALAARELRLRSAKDQLALQLITNEWRSGLGNEAQSSATTPAVPLPRSRPVVAEQDAPAASAPVVADNGSSSDNRTILQKLTDLWPGKIKLASLTPDSGLFHRGPDLAAMGYDRQTAVYDISARTVYLPGGLSLEAHSGIGSLRDDPEHVNAVNLGATPPATYDLKQREQLFHGVRALRMIPSDGSNTLGRSGLLTHSYMLGPNGDSNGCVSIRDYDRFLKAFDNGEISRLVVVPSLSGTASASRRSTSES